MNHLNKQTTLCEEVKHQGISLTLESRSLHPSHVSIIPSGPNTGHKFYVNMDNDYKTNNVGVPVHIQFAQVNGDNWSSAEKDGVKINFVEHMLATYRGVGLDNAETYILGSDFCPIFSGGDKVLFDELSSRIVTIKNSQRQYFTLDPNKGDFENWLGDSYFRISRYNGDGVKITYKIGEKERRIPGYIKTFVLGRDDITDVIEAPSIIFRANSFHEEIFRNSRTDFEEDILKNFIIVDPDSKSLDSTYIAELFALHKIKDLIGDLSFLPLLIGVEIYVEKGGHGFHIASEKRHLTKNILFLLKAYRMYSVDIRNFVDEIFYVFAFISLDL